MYKISMFPEGYKHYDREQVRWVLELIDSNIGLNQVIWSDDLRRVADFLEEADALDGDMLAALVAVPLYGSSRFVSVDLNVQVIAAAYISCLKDEGLTLEQQIDRILTSNQREARMRLAVMLQKLCSLPLPDTVDGELAWYKVAHAIVYMSETLSPYGREADDLLPPQLMAKFGDAAGLALTALRDLDSDLVEDLHGLERKLREIKRHYSGTAQQQLPGLDADAQKAQADLEHSERLRPKNRLKL